MANSIIQRPLDGYDAANFNDSKHTNISQVERAFYRRIGRVVVVDLAFTVSTTISGVVETIFSGLPKSAGFGTRFRLPSTNVDRKSLVLAVDNDGKMVNQWSEGGITPAIYQGSFTYICQ